ncbi:MAG: glycosyltransferase family 4 protein, partial [Cyanobacteria bacterium P01_A01_bin.105]
MPAAASHRRYSSQNEGPRSFDRILFLVQMQPYPLTGGVSLRNWQNLNLLNAQGIVGIFSIYKGCPGVETLPQFAFWHHYDLTTPQRSLSEKVQRRLWPLRPAGNARSDWLYTHTVAQQLQQVLHTFQPDLIVIEEIWLYRYLPHLRRQGCPIILDNHNVEGDDSRYPAGSAMTPKKLTKVRFIEEQLIRQVDQVWMCSQPDVDQLHALYPRSRDAIAAKAQVIPNGINPDDYGAIRAGTLPPPPTLSTP